MDPKLSALEKEGLLKLLKASEDRVVALKDFMKPPQLEMIKDASGNVEKIVLKGPEEFGSKYIGTIDKNTPVNEAMESFKKFYEKEELLHGDPLKDLMKPRKLSAGELAKAAGKGAAVGGVGQGLHFYCSNETAIQLARSANERASSASAAASSSGSRSSTSRQGAGAGAK